MNFIIATHGLCVQEEAHRYATEFFMETAMGIKINFSFTAAPRYTDLR